MARKWVRAGSEIPKGRWFRMPRNFSWMDFAQALCPRPTSPCRGIFSPAPISTRTRLCGLTPAIFVATASVQLRSSAASQSHPRCSLPTRRKMACGGHCEVDYPRKAIVSPYGFKTAQAHYEALLEETKKRGGPNVYSFKDFPARNGMASTRARSRTGRDRRPGTGLPQPGPHASLSVLTPEYQQRVVQEAYHHVRAHPLWPATFCWPEGSCGDSFIRRCANTTCWSRRMSSRSPRALPAISSRGCISAAGSTWTTSPRAVCRAWAPRCRAGTASPSASGTRTP